MAVIKKEQLDLVQVEYEYNGKKAILSFMDMEEIGRASCRERV